MILVFHCFSVESCIRIPVKHIGRLSKFHTNFAKSLNLIGWQGDIKGKYSEIYSKIFFEIIWEMTLMLCIHIIYINLYINLFLLTV